MGFPIAGVLVYLLSILELFAGAALVLGLFTRPIAVLFAIEMLFVVMWHFPNGYMFTNQHGGYEFPLLMLLVYIGILFAGSGECSIDRAIGKQFRPTHLPASGEPRQKAPVLRRAPCAPIPCCRGRRRRRKGRSDQPRSAC